METFDFLVGVIIGGLLVYVFYNVINRVLKTFRGFRNGKG